MSGNFTGAKRRIVYKSGQNNAWIQMPKFWVGYVGALHLGAFPTRVDISMDEKGVLTITPDLFEETNHKKCKFTMDGVPIGGQTCQEQKVSPPQ